jgi:flagellar biosynthesis protein FlhF
MKIKRYEGQYVHEVIAQVRDELGPEAVVLHTRWRHGSGLKRLLGRPQVEVWAGVQDGSGAPAPALVTAAAADVAMAEPLGVRAQAWREAIEAAPPAPEPVAPVGLDLFDAPTDLEILDVSPEAQAMSRDELTVALLAEFNDALERIESKVDAVAAASNSPDSEARRPRVRALIDAGVEPDLAEAIGEAAEGHTLADTLYDAFAVTGEPRLNGEARVVAFIGPSGAGKTTTVAKLAGRYGLGRDARVVLVTLDTQRIGAAAQLQALGDLMGVPVIAARNAADAAARLRVARLNCDLVLIDTPACSGTGSPGWDQVLDALIGLEPDEIHLVVAATTKAADVRRSVEQFTAALPLAAVVVTKTDESADLGLLVNIAWRHHLPFSFLGCGPDIPGDVELATTPRLVQLAWTRRLDMAPQEAHS